MPPTQQMITDSRKQAVAGLVNQGITNPNQALDYLNYDQGQKVGDFAVGEVSNLINASLLGKNNRLTIPPTSTRTEADSFLAEVGYNSDLAMAEAQRQQAQQMTPQLNSLEQEKSGIINRLKQMAGMEVDNVGRQVQIEEELGVPGYEKDLAAIRKQIADERVAQRAREERITSRTGVARDFVTDELTASRERSAKLMADYAIYESALAGNIERAESKAERKVKLLNEPIQKEKEYLQTFLQINDSLSKSEKEKVQEQIRIKENLIKSNEEKQKSITEIAKMAGQNGADRSVVAKIMTASNPEEAMVYASGFMVNPLDNELKRSQIAKNYADSQSKTIKPPTGIEKTSLGFFNRGLQAVRDIVQIEDKFAGKAQAGSAFALNLPALLQTSEQQQYKQAQRAFTEARLRKESGAAIPPEEFKNDARTYFAQPGDTPETLKQKQIARAQVLESLRYSSGNAYLEFYGDTAVDSITVGNNKYYVGQIVEAPDGTKGVVLPDGSIETQ